MQSIEILKIRNNSVAIITFQLISLFLNLVSISFAARYLGVENFGKFNYLLAIVGIGAKIIDFGFNPIIFRELSKEYKAKLFLNSALIFRLLIIVSIIVLLGLLSYLIKFDKIEILLISLLCINIILSNKFTNVRELLTIPFKVKLKMYIPMLFVILDNLLLLISVLIMPYVKGGIVYFTIVYTFSNLPGLLLLIVFTRKEYDLSFNFELSEVIFLFRESLPLIGFIIFSFIYSQIDILILEHYSGLEAVGIYSSAMRLILPLKIIPNAIIISLFPIITNNINKKNYNEQILKFVTKLFLVFCVSFIVLMIRNSNTIISIVFGNKYIQASLPLTILSFGVFFDFFSFFLLDFFTAYNKQKFNFYFILLTTILLVILDILLIPISNFIGASLARVIAGTFGFIFLLMLIKWNLRLDIKFINFKFLLAIFFTVLTTILLSSINNFINVIISNLFFLLLLVLLRVFSHNEVNILLKLTKSNKIKTIINKIYFK